MHIGKSSVSECYSNIYRKYGQGLATHMSLRVHHSTGREAKPRYYRVRVVPDRDSSLRQFEVTYKICSAIVTLKRQRFQRAG
jgi:hypothetical protein